MTTAGGVSQLLQAWGRGDVQAGEDLIPDVYRELRRRAALAGDRDTRMAHRPGVDVSEDDVPETRD